MIEGDVAQANECWEDALHLAEWTIGVMEEMGQLVTWPDMLRCKGVALAGLDRLDEAQSALGQALAIAESQNSRRALCHILSALADLSERRGDPDKAKELLLRAQEMVTVMADATGSDEMRAMFMNSAKIKALMNSP